MKKIFIAIIATLTTIIGFAQVKNSKTETVKVWGNCEMCKETIEKAGNKKGDAEVVWNQDTHQATITYNTKTTSLNEVLKRIALAGYDNDVFAAPTKAYNNLPACCQYDRPDKKSNDVATTTTAKVETATNQSDLQNIYNAYFDLKDALVKSDAAIAATKATNLLHTISNVKMENLGSQHEAFMKAESSLKTNAQHISESKNIEHQRQSFMALSTTMYELMKIAKAATPVYYQHCPMYNNNKGANWLSKEANIKNPYYGNMMLTCGKVVDTINQ